MSDKPQRRITRTRSPHHRVVYSNQIASTISGADVRLRFGCLEKSSPEELVVEDQVDVFLGPVEAMGLYRLLGRQLERFDMKALETPPASEEGGGTTN